MFSLPRRSFLAASLAGAPALLLHGRALAAGDPFTAGVAAGDPEADGFVIWTRLAAQPLAVEAADGASTQALPLRWQVARDPQFTQVVASGEAIARPERAHCVHVEVAGLLPDRPYWYRFIAQGVSSPVGRAYTAPLAGAPCAHLRMTAASCSHWELGYFAAYRHMAQDENSRLTLFLGDYIYESGAQPNRPRSYAMPEAQTLGDYRRRYALHRTDTDLQALHAANACLATWDDHEVQDDYSGTMSKDPAISQAAFMLRRAAGYRAFCEFMPLRLSRVLARRNAYRLWHRLAWGDLAQFDVVDGRQFRSGLACHDGTKLEGGHMAPLSCPDLTDPSRTYLGAEQERWLYDGWARSTAKWNLMVQNLLIAPLTVNTPAGPMQWTDTWNGFGAARSRLINAMQATKLRNPITLAGDYHSSWLNDLRLDFNRPQDAPVAAEVVVTSITSNGPPAAGIKAALPNNPHIRYFDAEHRGYAALDLTAERMEVRCMAISDRADRAATQFVLQEKVVEAGRPGFV